MNILTRTILAHRSNYGRKRSLKDIKYIVLHYTGNDGDTDEGNINYFTGANRKASAHYFVDDDSISRSVPDNYVAYHCGGNLYSDVKKTGGGKLKNICTNTNSIGIEMCDTRKNNKYDITVKTRDNSIKLVKELMKRYNIGINNVVRHFDCTGKHCPRYYCPPYGSNKEWQKFKDDVIGKKIDKPINSSVSTNIKVGDVVRLNSGAKQYDGKTVNKSYANKDFVVYSISGSRVVLTINNVIIYAVNIKDIKNKNSQVSNNSDSSLTVRVNVSALNIRSGPTVNSKITGTIRDRGVYTIVEKRGTWGRLKSGVGWISLNYTTQVK